MQSFQVVVSHPNGGKIGVNVHLTQAWQLSVKALSNVVVEAFDYWKLSIGLPERI